ncbi:MAG TPA: hypothetical protein VEL47_04470, partial [Myxococcota bacterium]|nr:hypothetical protein [Myxococcota bacterium]
LSSVRMGITSSGSTGFVAWLTPIVMAGQILTDNNPKTQASFELIIKELPTESRYEAKFEAAYRVIHPQ